MKLRDLAVNDYFWVPNRPDSFRVYVYLGDGHADPVAYVAGMAKHAQFSLDLEVGLAQWNAGLWEQLPLQEPPGLPPVRERSWRDLPPML